MRGQTPRNKNCIAQVSPLDLAEDDKSPGGIRGQILLSWLRTKPSEG